METKESYNLMQPQLGLLNDKSISYLAISEAMIRPYEPRKVRVTKDGEKVVSYGQNSYGYDVTLSNEFVIYYGNNSILDPKNPKSSKYIRFVVEKPYYDLQPRESVLSCTNEYILMPKDVTGVLLGKSTYARLGILTNTTPLEAGWEGEVTLELTNLGNHPVRLWIDEGIAQILFFRGAAPPDETYNGNYQGQVGVTLAR